MGSLTTETSTGMTGQMESKSMEFKKRQEFIGLIREHEGMIYKITRIYLKQEEDQQDLYQEIVYQLWKSFDSFDSLSKWSTWMYRVAMNTAISHLNSQKNKPHKRPGQFPLEKLKIEPFDPLIEERINWLYKQIQELSIVEKGIILLYLEGKSHRDIADITGFSTSNVGTRIARIKQKLKDKLGK